MRYFYPLIHIIGLPGAGKTTLSERLQKKLRIPVYEIGEYRSKFPMSIYGEADAWVSLFRDLSKKKWKNCILETTGLNSRELFLKNVLPPSGMITIKLESKRSILYERIKKKKKHERGGNWLFTQYSDKYEFVRQLFKEFKKIPAEIKIDTSKLGIKEVSQIAVEQLKLLLE